LIELGSEGGDRTFSSNAIASHIDPYRLLAEFNEPKIYSRPLTCYFKLPREIIIFQGLR